MDDWYGCVQEKASERTIDEVGHRYGMLTVISPAVSDGQGARWLCRCDCGNTTVLKGVELRSGRRKSCGCVRVKNIVAVGQRFDRLTVLRELPSHRVECKCDCGNITTTSKYNLLNGNTRSCGCLCKKRPYRDLTGQRFGRLVVVRVLENPPTSSKSKQWICRCDCGNEMIASSPNLVSGGTRSCGCLASEAFRAKRIDETGKRYGKLTVIGQAVSEGGHARWICKCDCGNTTVVIGANLRSGNVRSCGCLRGRKATADG